MTEQTGDNRALVEELARTGLSPEGAPLGAGVPPETTETIVELTPVGEARRWRAATGSIR